MDTPIYLDNHATTPVDARVRDAMLPYLGAIFGNPASRTHAFGQRARGAVDDARLRVAEAIGATAAEVIFTSGATECLNLAIVGLARAARRGGPAVSGGAAADRERARVVCCFAADHSATRAAVAATAHEGMTPRELPVTSGGLPDLDALDDALAAAGAGGTLAVCVTAVHNELGVVAPIAAIAERCRRVGALLIVDAAQAPGRVAVDVDAWDADLVAITAHKCYGPKGAGALFVRRRGRHVRLEPLLVGGGQEQGLRAGTLAVAQIVGLAAALALAVAEREADDAHIRPLRDGLWRRLQALEGVHRNGDGDAAVAGNLSVRVEAVDAAALLVALPEVALSAGSACASGTPRPSHSLLAIGLSEPEALCSLRVGVGRMNTAAEVERAGELICAAISAARAASPLWAMRHDRAALDALGWGRR